jgi:hypothetical protein
MPVTPGRSPSAIMSVVHTILICRGCFLSNARVMMSIVYAVAWLYCLPMEYTGTPPAGWPSLCLPVELTGLIKC